MYISIKLAAMELGLAVFCRRCNFRTVPIRLPSQGHAELLQVVSLLHMLLAKNREPSPDAGDA